MSKKKYTQNDLRRLMQEQKQKSTKSNGIGKVDTKIESPLAKYDEKGQLTCILCKSIVRSENVWKVHVNSKNHKEKVEIARQLKEKLSSGGSTTSGKRTHSVPAPPTSNVPAKKAKTEDEKDATEQCEENVLPSDFFDSKETKTQTTESMEVEDDTKLPEGFFDDPKIDAKARNTEYKDPQEEEWAKFQKEIKEESAISLEIIAGEVETSTNDRQIQDIEEQMHQWERVLALEVKKEEISKILKEKESKMDADQSSDSSTDDDVDIDNLLDWRAKRIYKKSLK